jgi:hypothetical protein
MTQLLCATANQTIVSCEFLGEVLDRVACGLQDFGRVACEFLGRYRSAILLEGVGSGRYQPT